MKNSKEQMNVVIVGHVDHGKSTVIGRLLADTGTLPVGKLEAVKENCERNSKPFEYAFLIDALKDEQSQGITIDAARCFFKSAKRDYIIIDAPGHIEFLKNMVTGAARAEAAILVIDAHEGIKENSKRHGYMLSFLGIKNITVCVNKMDLVDYQKEIFMNIRDEYTKFLDEINIEAQSFIPISAREGENIIRLSGKMPWYQDDNVLKALDQFKNDAPKFVKEFRFPVQDIYKFTQEGDERRIVAGRVETGSIRSGDEVIFYPSQKKTRIKSIEAFHEPPQMETFAGLSAGFCLETQVFIKPGEIMCKLNERAVHVSTKFKANIFWMGRQPLVKGKNYKVKIATQQVPVVLADIFSVLDASELSSIQDKPLVNRHDVAECVFETLKPVAFDEASHISQTGRFVIVDNYEIAGGGIILSPVFEDSSVVKDHIRKRELTWDRSEITPEKRSSKYQHKSGLLIITGPADTCKQQLAKALEEELFKTGWYVYFLGVSQQWQSTQKATNDRILNRLEYIQQLGEMAHILTDAGLVLLASISDIDDYELEMLKSLNRPHATLVVNVGENQFGNSQVDLQLPSINDISEAVPAVIDLLKGKVQLDPEYFL